MKSLYNRIERESCLTRKKSITVEAESIFRQSLNNDLVQGQIPSSPSESESENLPQFTSNIPAEHSLPEPHMDTEVLQQQKTPTEFIKKSLKRCNNVCYH